MIGAILKATNSSLQKSMTLCRSIYVTKVMKLLAFIYEQTSYGTGAKQTTPGVTREVASFQQITYI